MRTKILIISFLATCVMFVSCSELSSVASQLQGVANLVNCEYSLKNISNVTVAGVNVKQVSGGNISATDVVKLTTAILQKSVPLAMNVNVNVKNPTSSKANLTQMQWALDIENTQFAQGMSSTAYTIPAKSTTAVPLGVSTDIYSLFSSKGIESLKSFAGSFNSSGKSSKVGLRIKPSVQIAGKTVTSPKYINITKS